MQFSTKHIDYLERAFTLETDPEQLSGAEWAMPVAGTTNLLHLRARTQLDDPAQAIPPSMAEMTDVLIGLHARESSFIFAALGDQDRVTFHAGSCRHAVGGSGGQHPEIVDAGPLLQGVCPGLEISPVTPDSAAALTERLRQLSCTAVAVGTPTLKPFADRLVGSQMDRVRRSLQDCSWGYVVCALPVPQSGIASIANRTLNETRIVSESSRAAGAPSPVGEKYVSGLEALWEKSQNGKAQGLWHSVVYLLAGNAGTLQRIKAVVRAVMSGPDSVPDPFTVVDAGKNSAEAAAFGVPLTEPPEAPGQIAYAYRFLTLLSSPELATLAQAPMLETPGFHVIRRASFDVNPHGEQASEGISLGEVIDQGRAAGPRVVIEPKTLRRHAMVTGTTGSGKTNTVFHLLQNLAAREVPFLVIEPVKSEYRCLGEGSGSGSPLQVFTPGREGCAPLRLNPFEVQPGLSVSEHLDLLRAAFAASFGLWTPLPQVLEQSLHAVYRDKGWDLVRNNNRRVDSEASWSGAFPTLTDLVGAVRLVTERLGYSSETTDEIRSALLTRLNAMRLGGKGRMLDVERSLPVELLFNRPTVIELEGLGADEDKAFVMALIMIQLAAFRRRSGPRSRLEHLLVIEEAHRLLANVALQREERAADPRGKAVETFVNLLAEVRAYGQGVVVVDQVPVKLAPDLIKNTNLKIAHRIVAETDRVVLGGSMIMNDDQERALATLRVGQAAVFGAGDDSALLVRIPLAAGVDTDALPADEEIGARMQTMLEELGPWAARFAPCGAGCSGSHQACEAAAAVVDDLRFQTVFARLALSSIRDPDALNRGWPDLLQAVRALRPEHVTEENLLRCAVCRGAKRLSDRRGAQSGWSFADTRRFDEVLRGVLLTGITGGQTVPAEEFSRLEGVAAELWSRTVDPFPRCSEVCSAQPPVCRYRDAVADQIEGGRFDAPWRNADTGDREEGKGPRRTWQTCMDAVYELIEFPETDWPDGLREETALAARRAALCFGQQMFSREAGNTPRTVRISMDRLLREARHG